MGDEHPERGDARGQTRGGLSAEVDDEDVFVVGFECDNCGALFERSYPAGTRVYRSSRETSALVRAADEAPLNASEVTCPVCRTKCVGIEDRTPL